MSRLILEAASKRLALVIAPPGYGKTTAVWQALISHPLAWHTVREGETGAQVGGRLYRALEGFAAPSALGGFRPSSAADAARVMSKAAAGIGGAGWIVIDGWDRGDSSLVHLIQGLLDFGSSRMHVVVLGEAHPDLRLASAIRRGGVGTISPDQLLFTRDEVHAYLAHHWNSDAADTLAESVHRLSRGWPAGMTLTVLANPSPVSVESVRTSSMEPERNEVEKLLETLPGAERRMLLVSAVLPEFSPDLVASLVGESATPQAAASLLDRVAYATRSSWGFTVVPSLRSLLKGMADLELPSEERRRILHGAAEYFSHTSRPQAAVDLFLESGDTAGACRMLDGMGVWGILQEDTARHIAWGEKLEGREAGWGAHFVCARARELRGDVSGAARHYRAALEEGGHALCALDRLQILPELHGALVSSGDPDAERITAEIAAVVPDDARSEVLHRLLHAKALRTEGRMADAEATLEPTLSMLRDFEGGRFLSHWLNVLGEIRLVRGHYDRALQSLRAVVDRIGPVDSRDRVNNLQMLGRLHGLCGDFDLAAGRLGAALHRAEEAGLTLDQFILALDLSLVATWSGRIDQALRWFHHAKARSGDFVGSRSLDQTLRHFAARIRWAEGTREDAAAAFLQLAREKPSLYDASTHYSWSALDAALVLLRSGEEDLAVSILCTVEARTRRLDARHQLCNALLLKGHALGPCGSATMAQARRMLEAGRFTFLPALDARVIGHAEAKTPFGFHEASTSHLADPASVDIDIRTLGGFSIRRGGIPLDDTVWYRCGRARQLFQLLLSQHTLACAGDEIIEALWPDADGVRGRQRLHTTASDLRRVLRRAGLSPAISLEYRHGFYRLVVASNVVIDHVGFTSEADRGFKLAGEGDIGKARDALATAVSRYGGPFLPDARYEQYADFMRERVHQQLLRCLTWLAHTEREDIHKSLEWWRMAAAHDPYDEDIHRGYIQACAHADRTAEANRALAAFESHLSGELGLPLPAWAAKLRASGPKSATDPGLARG